MFHYIRYGFLSSIILYLETFAYPERFELILRQNNPKITQMLAIPRFLFEGGII